MKHELPREENLPLDTTKFELLSLLQSKGIYDKSVLEAIEKIPRERFVPAAFVRKAYNDVALPIGLNQTISQPYTVAFMTQELDVKSGCCVLEIGTGSGYQAAILDAMGAKVVSLERHQGLFERALKTLHDIGSHVECIFGDGSMGYEKFAPYDRIIVTAGAPDVPQQLLHQLKIGGKMIVPVGTSLLQQMHVIRRISDTEFVSKTPVQEFSFVPLLGEKGWKNNRLRGQGS